MLLKLHSLIKEIRQIDLEVFENFKQGELRGPHQDTTHN